MSLKTDIINIAKRAKKASQYLNTVSESIKNNALTQMSKSLLKDTEAILKANKLDIAVASKAGKSAAFCDRLKLTDARIKKMSADLICVAGLSDPVGQVIKMFKRPNGLIIEKIRVPLGVIGIIYESRPNVTSDCAGLCLKAGNAVILRGGRESINSNIAIYKAISKAIKKSSLPEGCINLIESVDRKAVNMMLEMSDYIDLVIPRGGESLIRMIVENSKIPVIKHYKGICHSYVDEYADLDMAEEVVFNAKVQRPSTCNAMECLLVHKKVAKQFLPRVITRFQTAGVEIRGCSKTASLVKGIKRATARDYATEYLDLVLSVKIVDNMAAACQHIAKYGTGHSEAIITNNFQTGLTFLKIVDAACVYVNASTRFTDGNQFGLGAEIGISTDKLHARGPMGLEELTTYKYIIMGNGQIRT